MKIREIEIFDLYGDGTLVLKTNMEKASDDFRYAWNVKLNGRYILKGAYQKRAFTALQLAHLGKYEITAFVRNGAGEKVEERAEFHASLKTSPFLAVLEKENALVRVTPHIEQIDGGICQFTVQGNLPDGATCAWYVYQAENEAEPVFRSQYSEDSQCRYESEKSGDYYAKLFLILDDGQKLTFRSDVFTV